VLVRQAVINYASEYGRYGYRAVTDLLRTEKKKRKTSGHFRLIKTAFGS